MLLRNLIVTIFELLPHLFDLTLFDLEVLLVVLLAELELILEMSDLRGQRFFLEDLTI